MAYNGNSSKIVSSSFLFSTLQSFYTKIKGLLDGKSDTAHTHSAATTSANGFMSSTDKSKLDGIANGATKIVVDSALNSSSTNPVQNKIVTNALSNINPTSIAAGYTNKSFYLNTHPENSGVLIPFINNDIAFLLKRGGSAKIYYDNIEQSVDISSVFDGPPSYWYLDITNVKTIVVELTLHKIFAWTNTVYVDFGSTSWRASSIIIDVMNTNNNETEWTNKSTITNNTIGEHKITFSHNEGTGFNKVRFTFSEWVHASIFRIACLGIINYGSSGLRETFLPKDGGTVYGGINPSSTNALNLGSSSLKWSNIYATKFNGDLNGAATTLTGLTSTVTELNYCDGVTSNIQTQLNGKANTSHTHSYLPLSGGTLTNTLSSSKSTNTYLAGNQGGAIINSTSGAGSYTMLSKLNSTNGYFTDGVYGAKRLFQYTSKDTVDAEQNSVTKSVTLLDESGNSSFPGTVIATTFSGNLSGNATTANNAYSSVFTIPNNGSANVEGGELHIGNTDGTVWSIDSYNNTLRIYDSNGVVHLTLNKSSTSSGTFIGTSTNADKVDGFHVGTATGNYLRPINYGTSALTAGSSSLTTGYIYLQYE